MYKFLHGAGGVRVGGGGDPIQMLGYDCRNECKGKVKYGENIFKKEK